MLRITRLQNFLLFIGTNTKSDSIVLRNDNFNVSFYSRRDPGLQPKTKADLYLWVQGGKTLQTQVTFNYVYYKMGTHSFHDSKTQ